MIMSNSFSFSKDKTDLVHKSNVAVFTSKSLNHIQNKEGDVQCLICKSYSNTIIYVCESGRYLCKTCKSIDNEAPHLEKPRKTSKAYGNQYTSFLNLSDNNKKQRESDLASGDNDKVNKTPKTLHILKQESNFDNTQHCQHFSRDVYDNNDNNKDTIIKYKNIDYKESTSSIESISMNITNFNHKEININDEVSKKIARPIVCPVTACGKMIAIDSTLQHFCFDHSKVPKILLKAKKSQRLIQKSCIFTKDTHCIAIITHQYYPSDSWTRQVYPSNAFDTDSSQSHLFLMCAMTSGTIKDTDRDTINKHYERNLLSKTKSNIRNINSDRINTNQEFNHDESLLLWLCRTDNNTHSYKLTLSRKDKLQSYSFTGEAIHIRENQDARSIHERSDCLIVKGRAANRLLDEQNQLHIFISNY